MAKNSLELQGIVVKGGAVIVDGARYNSLELQSVAMKAKEGNGRLIVKNADRFNSLELQSIAAAGPGHTEFDLT